MVEVYVSTDVEADGPIPGPNSMLSFASAAYLADKSLVGTFSANVTTLPGASGDPKTMKWWEGQPEAWAACRVQPRDPAVVMPEYVAWLKGLPGKPVFVGYPVAYDFMFVYWYLMRFAGESPFSHSALDIKSYAMDVLGLPYGESVKRNMPAHWFDELPHTHVALDDAKGQGVLFCNMLRASRDSDKRVEMLVAAGALSNALELCRHEAKRHADDEDSCMRVGDFGEATRAERESQRWRDKAREIEAMLSSSSTNDNAGTA